MAFLNKHPHGHYRAYHTRCYCATFELHPHPHSINASTTGLPQPQHQNRRSRVNHNSTTVCGNTQIAKKTILEELMGQFSDDDEDEFTRYLSETQINNNEKPCLWWKARETV
ncbi:unnamed protein product [Macrosiphum euphorbiae]|uniref:HAT C-terminal dimerisation domain-containing protein n=1 Tax=Macrosiphum euphorbiae TaxID=13131 RepID=A0AAV0WNP7_9HEMI|nr:unnamed protein product [Macrosiphum euphorbiae]